MTRANEERAHGLHTGYNNNNKTKRIAREKKKRELTATVRCVSCNFTPDTIRFIFVCCVYSCLYVMQFTISDKRHCCVSVCSDETSECAIAKCASEKQRGKRKQSVRGNSAWDERIFHLPHSHKVFFFLVHLLVIKMHLDKNIWEELLFVVLHIPCERVHWGLPISNSRISHWIHRYFIIVWALLRMCVNTSPSCLNTYDARIGINVCPTDIV